MSYIYQLSALDMSQVGGPMHLARTTISWTKPFSTLEKAKDYAEENYKRTAGREAVKVQWKQNRRADSWCTQDLSWVMYEIEKVKVYEV